MSVKMTARKNAQHYILHFINKSATHTVIPANLAAVSLSQKVLNKITHTLTYSSLWYGQYQLKTCLTNPRHETIIWSMPTKSSYFLPS